MAHYESLLPLTLRGLDRGARRSLDKGGMATTHHATEVPGDVGKMLKFTHNCAKHEGISASAPFRHRDRGSISIHQAFSQRSQIYVGWTVRQYMYSSRQSPLGIRGISWADETSIRRAALPALLGREPIQRLHA